MAAMPRTDNRHFSEGVTVVCGTCKRETRLIPAKRNNHAFPGAYCDGEYGVAGEKRHALRLMTGPEGKAYA